MSSKKSFWTLMSLSFCVGICILIYGKWFFTKDIFTWGDWGWYFPETVRPWLDYPRIWFAGPFGGIDVGIFQYLPARLVYSILARFTDFAIFDRIVFLLPSVLFPAFSSFIFLKYITKKNLAAIIGTLIFVLNSYLAVIRTGHFTLADSFSLAPLILYFVLKGIENKKVINSIWAGLVGAIAFAYEPRAFLLTFGIAFLYVLYVSIFTPKLNLGKRLGIFLHFLVPMVIVVALHAYAFIGLHFASGQISTQITSRALFGSGYVSINRGLALEVSSWNEATGKGVQLISAYFWIVPIMAMFGLWVGRKSKVIVFFGLILLIGLFLNKHINQPFGFAYIWLYKYLPGFNAFREPSKFYFFIGLGYSVLVAWYIAWVQLNKNIKWLVVVSLICLFPVLRNGITIYEGKVGGLMTPRHVPTDYIILKEFLQKNGGDYRVGYLPAETRWGYWDEHIRKLSLINLPMFQWPEMSTYSKEGPDYSYLELTMNLLEQPYSNALMDIGGIKYVIIPPEDMANGDIFTFAFGNRDEYLRRARNLSYLRELKIGTSNLIIFENEDLKPFIYVTQKPDSPANPTQPINISYLQIKPYQYELEIPKDLQSSSKYINLTDQYNQGWKLYYGRVNWIDVILHKNLVSGVLHNETQIHGNEFVLREPHSQNQFTLYFEPQAYIYIGVAISLISAGILGILLIIYSSKSLYDLKQKN